ncbi:MAG: LysR family transcriptional regulator [Granulosicoccus sp.]|nr:LysR family transcriptional regulator [Granulosicoccus sp.]
MSLNIALEIGIRQIKIFALLLSYFELYIAPMKHNLPPLDSLKVFESAARLLSFTKASKELCITKGAVSYQIKQLEQQVGVALFRRSTRQIFLTNAGQTLSQTVREVFDQIGTTIQRIHASKLHDVTIAATTYVAARWLSPRVARFLELHPDITVRFEHRVNDRDFQLEQADLTLIWGDCQQPPGQNTIARLPMKLFPVANQEQAHRLQTDATWQHEITLLTENRSQDLWLEWFGQGSLTNPRHIIEDANVRVQAAINGQGMMLADQMMQHEIDNGLLVPPFNHGLTDYGYILKKSFSNDVNPAVNKMLEWLIRCIPEIPGSKLEDCSSSKF